MNDLKELLDSKKKIVDKKATEYRNVRDEWNSKTKNHRDLRTAHYDEVRELLVNLKQQKDSRDELNEIVRELKATRSKCNKNVKEMKKKIQNSQTGTDEGIKNRRGKHEKHKVTIYSLKRDFTRLEREFELGKHTGKNEKKVMEKLKRIKQQIKQMESDEESNEELSEAREMLNAAIQEQEEAHALVTEAAQKAQDAHTLMLEWSKEVDQKRTIAENAHKNLKKSKKQADNAHHYYIVSLRCLHSIQFILRAYKDSESGAAPEKTSRIEVQDMMKMLMSGETLTTEQLMDLQKNK